MRVGCIIAIASCVLFMAGCARTISPQPESKATVASDQTPVIVHVRGRDRTVTIKSGPKGLLYSMHDEQGRTLLTDATAAEFKAQHPQLYQMIRDINDRITEE